MKTLKTLAAPFAIAAASLIVAMPAQARDNRYDPQYQQGGQHQQQISQHQGGYNQQQAWQLTPQRNAEIRQDINSLGNAIDRAAARRTISSREASGLRGQARDIQRLYANYARGGLTRAEVGNLQSRVNNVRVALRMERRDWDNRRG